MRICRAVRPPALAIAALLIALAAGLPARPAGWAVADDTPSSSAGRTARDVGKGFKDFGKKIGAAGKQVGREVADAAKMVWYKGKQVSKPRLDQIQEKTREFWSKVIEGKDRTIDDLRRENAELKRRAAERKDAD